MEWPWPTMVVPPSFQSPERTYCYFILNHSTEPRKCRLSNTIRIVAFLFVTHWEVGSHLAGSYNPLCESWVMRVVHPSACQPPPPLKNDWDERATSQLIIMKVVPPITAGHFYWIYRDFWVKMLSFRLSEKLRKERMHQGGVRLCEREVVDNEMIPSK